MQSCALGRRIEIALEFGREILQFHSDNRNIRCRGPSLSLCRKSPNILDIRHHSQIRRLRLARAIWLLSAWFRFRPNAAHEARRPLHQPRSATTLIPASAPLAGWTKPLRGERHSVELDSKWCLAPSSDGLFQTNNEVTRRWKHWQKQASSRTTRGT